MVWVISWFLIYAEGTGTGPRPNITLFGYSLLRQHWFLVVWAY